MSADAMIRRALSARDLRALDAELRREHARLEAIGGTTADARHEVAQALQRIEDGTYGDCARCARRIPLERLEVVPATRVCVSCAR